MTEYKYLFFDLDGTLTDPGLGITNSVMHALKRFGLEVPKREELYSYIGPPLKDSFALNYGFDEEKCSLAVTYYREYFGVKGLFENEVYKGIPEMLSKLRESGYKLIVATSKPEEYSVKIIKHFDLDKYFDYICGSNMDETRSKKAEVIAYALELAGVEDKSKVLMIGDRKHDIEGAKANGLNSLGVTYGYGDYDELKEAGADYIVDSVSELLNWLT